jgi:putative oxidoreductase
MKLGLAVLRLVLGALFIGHGAQKLSGSFGGHGPEGTGAAFESLGLKPGKPLAMAAGANEAAGGALVGLGLFTPLGASLISSTMLTAIWTAHRKQGVWAASGGYEYNLVILAAVFALSDLGPGDLSLDAARGSEMHGLAWALLQLAAAAAGSAAVIGLGKREVGGEPAASDEGQAGPGDPATA